MFQLYEDPRAASWTEEGKHGTFTVVGVVLGVLIDDGKDTVFYLVGKDDPKDKDSVLGATLLRASEVSMYIGSHG